MKIPDKTIKKFNDNSDSDESDNVSRSIQNCQKKSNNKLTEKMLKQMYHCLLKQGKIINKARGSKTKVKNNFNRTELPMRQETMAVVDNSDSDDSNNFSGSINNSQKRSMSN